METCVVEKESKGYQIGYVLGSMLMKAGAVDEDLIGCSLISSLLNERASDGYVVPVEIMRKIDRIVVMLLEADTDFIESLVDSLLQYVGIKEQVQEALGLIPAEQWRSFNMRALQILLKHIRDEFFISCLLMCLKVTADLDSEPVERDKEVVDGAAYEFEKIAFFMSKEQKLSLWSVLKIIGKMPAVNI